MNVAMKGPRAQFGRTLAFYRDTLALTVREETSPEVPAVASRSVHVGARRCCGWSRSTASRELWLELLTDVERAMAHLTEHRSHAKGRAEQLRHSEPPLDHQSGGGPHIIHELTARHDAGTIRRAAQGDKRMSGSGGGGIPSDTRCRRRTRPISTLVALAPEVIAVHEQF